MVDKLIGEEVSEDGSSVYTGTVAKILGLCGFTLKVMVCSGESCPPIIELLGGGVLGMTWEPALYLLMLTMQVNLTPRCDKVHTGPALTMETISQLQTAIIMRRLVLSLIYTIYDPLGILVPLTIRLKLVLQKRAADGDKAEWDKELHSELRDDCLEALQLMVLCTEVRILRSILQPKAESDYSLVC